MTLEHKDSTSAMQSLLTQYAESDSDDEEKKEKSKSAVDAISDEEADTPTPTPNANVISQPSSRPPSSLAADDEHRSGSDLEHGKKGKKRKHTRLVSYGADDLEEEDEEEEEEEDSPDSGGAEHGTGYVEGKIMNSSLNIEQASSLSRSMLNKSLDEIELPLEPQGTCSARLQSKIAELYQRRRREGLNLNNNIQHRVDFRNPRVVKTEDCVYKGIYEKLIEYCGIDEKGTNYPPELYDPSIWGKESYYDALDKAQKADMEKREKERKERTKVEFVTGTKKSASKSDLTSSNTITIKTEEKKRKSKWDAEPTQPQAIRVADNINRSIAAGGANLTITATGTKSTVIPATGNISKKVSK